MATIGHGYGSEWHLLRFLGRHRETLDKRVLKVCGGDGMTWLDYPFVNGRRWQDGEWKGLDFLPAGHPARTEWTVFWPRLGNVQNWDVVGMVSTGGVWEWLLVEAKAHVDELKSSCQAKPRGGLAKIEGAFSLAKRELGVPEDADWLHGYYQYCNRLTALHFLNTRGVSSRLLMVYFVGDWIGTQKRKCPASSSGWTEALVAMDKHTKLPPSAEICSRIHKLFIDVRGKKIQRA